MVEGKLGKPSKKKEKEERNLNYLYVQCMFILENRDLTKIL